MSDGGLDRLMTPCAREFDLVRPVVDLVLVGASSSAMLLNFFICCCISICCFCALIKVMFSVLRDCSSCCIFDCSYVSFSWWAAWASRPSTRARSWGTISSRRLSRSLCELWSSPLSAVKRSSKLSLTCRSSARRRRRSSQVASRSFNRPFASREFIEARSTFDLGQRGLSVIIGSTYM